MSMLSGWIRGPWIVALLVVSMALPETLAAGKRGGGGRGGRAPRQAAPRRPSAQAFKMPRAMNNAARSNNMANHRANNTARTANVKGTGSGKNVGTTNGTSRSLAGINGTGTLASRPTSYSYGSSTNARHYTANGYGHGYRNRSSSRGYGRSQSNVRAIVSRLRSVHSGLARIDHDYRGHRVKAMHAISSAIRQLSHRSSSLNGNGNMNRMIANNGGIGNANRANGNNGRNQGAGRNGANGGAGQGNRLSQAQSDARMSQALRTTQGIHMQLTNQGTNSTHQMARTHVARAANEMRTALTIR